MSKSTVERKIVQMVFEAKKFEQGIRSSLESLSDFKKAFQLESAARSLTELESAADVDFSPMSKALDSINNKLSITGVAAAAVITKITESVMSGAKKLASTLIFDPITGGLSEYETQLNAVQTILANTAKAGTDLQDVTAALAELNEYADLTIYNFTQMVSNIGKFTTAGVDLETSVQAIKGIANVGAISGAGANEVSTAMYQMSQAISSGVVRLQDWMSIENAGMGGVLFQDSLMETARVHGISVDRMVEKNGSFRLSLSEGWLTDDIMLETLDKFTGDLTDQQLKALGYTDEQIKGIQQTAQLALDAATKIKTLTALKDTLAEVLGSGWAQTWEILFGDFEQAKELWGKMAEMFTPLIERSTEARNDLLTTWAAAGGRSKFIQAMFNIIEVGIAVVKTLAAAFSEIFGGIAARDLLVLTNKFLAFSESLKTGYLGFYKFKMVAKGVFAVLDIIRMVIVAVLTPFKALLPVLSGGAGGFLDFLVAASLSIQAFRDMAKETGFFHTVVAGIVVSIKKFVEQTKELVQQLLDLEVVKAVVQWFKDLERADFVRVWDGFLQVLKAIITPFVALALVIEAAYEELLKLKAVQDIIAWFQDLSLEATIAWFRDIQTSIKDLVDEVQNSDLIQKFLEVIGTFDGRRVKEFFAEAKSSWAGIADSTGQVKEGLASILPDLSFITDGLKTIGGAIKDGLNQIFDYLLDNAGNLDFNTLFKIINTGLFAGLILSIRELAGMFSLDTIFGDSDIGDALVEGLEEVGSVLSGLSISLKADALKNVAIAIALLAGSIFLLTLTDSVKLAAATESIALMTLALFGATGALATINIKGAVSAAIAIIGVSVAIGIAALALKQVADIDPARLEGSLDAMAKGLAALVVSTVALSKGSQSANLLKTVLIMYGLARALKMLSGAIQTFGAMKPEVLSRGMIGISAALGMLTASTIAMSRFGGNQSAKAGAGMLIIAGALLALSFAVESFGLMEVAPLEQGLTVIALILGGFVAFTMLIKEGDFIQAGIAIAIIAGALFILAEAVELFAAFTWKEIVKSLVAIAAMLGVLAIAAKLMTGAQPAAVAMGIMALAILGLAVAFVAMQELSWDDIKRGLVVIAATLGILAVAGYVMAPVVPILIGLGIAMALIGLGALMFGAGLFIAALGLVAIAGAAIPIAAAIKIVGAAIIEVLPGLAAAFAEAIVNFITVIAEKTPEIIGALQKMILAMLGALIDPEFLPEILSKILAFVTAMIEALAEGLPDLLQAVYDVLLALLKGIGDNIADVVAAGLEIIEEFMEGISDGFPDLLLQAGETILIILEGIETAIDEYMAQIIAAGVRIAVAIVEGLVDGIKAGWLDLKAAIIKMANDALEALHIPWRLKSPSRATYDMALLLIKGFVNGIRDNVSKVRDAFKDFRDILQREIDPLIQGIVDELDRSPEFRPVISPVLDLDNINRGVAKLQRTTYASGILSAVEYEQGGGYAIAPMGIAESASTAQPVTFVQHNYSPKALDRETIYRQTRTQLAKLKEERSFG